MLSLQAATEFCDLFWDVRSRLYRRYFSEMRGSAQSHPMNYDFQRLHPGVKSREQIGGCEITCFEIVFLDQALLRLDNPNRLQHSMTGMHPNPFQ